MVDFGGFRALDRAEIRAGTDEVVGLIGPNGAGKTTLLNVITGVVDCSEGDLKINGKSIEGLQPHMIARAGLVRTFQNLRLFHLLSVRENIEVARLASPDANNRLETVAIEELLHITGLDELRNRRAGELDYGNARRLELARAAAANPVFLLLDEPTSGMSDHESEAMIHQVRSVASLIGAGVVVIDHDLNFITGICDRVYVLDQGRLISTGSPEEISLDEKVRAAYLGSS